MGPHIPNVVQGITYHLPLAEDPHATPLHKKVSHRLFVANSVACGSMCPKVVVKDLDGFEWYMWVHIPDGDRCKDK